VYDVCYCNTENFPTASSFISTFVVTGCHGTQAVTSAIAVYTDYCSTFNQAQAITTNEAGATAATNTNVNFQSGTSTNIIINNNGGNTPTATVIIDNGGAQRSSSVIGRAIGVPLGVIILFAIIL
jgi:hypothetical protein